MLTESSRGQSVLNLDALLSHHQLMRFSSMQRPQLRESLAISAWISCTREARRACGVDIQDTRVSAEPNIFPISCRLKELSRYRLSQPRDLLLMSIRDRFGRTFVRHKTSSTLRRKKQTF